MTSSEIGKEAIPDIPSMIDTPNPEGVRIMLERVQELDMEIRGLTIAITPSEHKIHLPASKETKTITRPKDSETIESLGHILTRSTLERSTIIKTMDQVIPRTDGKSWAEAVDQTSSELDESEATESDQ